MSVHLNSNPIKLLNHPAIKPDVGCCAKFGAFIIASAGVVGLATAAFGGPIASSALAGTVGKVAEATGAVGGIKTAGKLLIQAGGAHLGHTIAQTENNAYIDSRCTSMIDSVPCFGYAVGSLFGIALIGAAAWFAFKIMKESASK